MISKLQTIYKHFRAKQNHVTRQQNANLYTHFEMNMRPVPAVVSDTSGLSCSRKKTFSDQQSSNATQIIGFANFHSKNKLYCEDK
jgi:hypothetical protein